MIPKQLAKKRATKIRLALVSGLCLILLSRPYFIAKYHGQGRRMEGWFMPYAQLAGTDLSNCDLMGADLMRANLSHARLRGSHMNVANLEHADLRGADLRGVDLTCADLSYATLAHADLRGAKLFSTCLHTDFTGANLSGVAADLEGIEVWLDCDFSDANLSNARIGDGVSMSGSKFWRCDMRGAELFDGPEFEPSSYVSWMVLSGPSGEENFGHADLRGAIADKHTTWPDDFDPKRSGVVLLPQ